MRYRLSYGDRTVGVSDLRPFRKSLALTIAEGNKERILAYFKSEEHAKLFDDFISNLPIPFLEDNII